VERNHSSEQGQDSDRKPKTVTEQLVQKLSTVQFTQLLRCIQVESGTRIGEQPGLELQPVRLIAEADPIFPANELASWTGPLDTGSRAVLGVTFFGLFGPSGALPDHYTQLILERGRLKDHSLREFLNIFNHRLLCLFYQAWEKHAFAVSMETSAAAEVSVPLTEALWAVIGHRLDAAKNRFSFDDDSLLYYGGLMATTRPSQENLRGCLEGFSGLPTAIEPLVGQWLMLEPEDQSRIGSFPLGVMPGNQLGIDTIAGSRVWDVENRFRIRFGPLDWKTFESHLPTGPALLRAAELTRRMVGPQWEFDFQLLLSADEVRGARLDSSAPFHLGWNTWLGEWPSSECSDTAIFELPGV
jgi:type VI secretion system protein ImpH